MASLDISEKIERQSLYKIGYEYLCDNFHKFKEQNKIKVAIAILNIFEKDDSKSKQDMKQIIVMNDIRKEDNQIRFNIGSPIAENS